MKPIPEVLAARAVHSYRRRDIFAYVSLRQYLRNSAALRDIWSDELATELLAERRTSYYNVVKSFKEVAEDQNQPIFRVLHVPGPNDILAETALLHACAEVGGVFTQHRSVFSYALAKENKDTLGVFLPYFDGFKARHAAIAAACRAQPDAVVVYTDIKQFYPSITIDHALRVWRNACDQTKLAPRYSALGVKMIEDARTHQEKAEGEAGILTGPMLSHLIGNLVLRAIDDDLSQALPGGYFRYVDDVAIVAPSAKALEIEHRLTSQLERLGLHLNQKKRLETASSRWLESANDFDDQPGISWMTFIADMKRLLFFNPAAKADLQTAFRGGGVRINPPDYSEVAQERNYLDRLHTLSEFRWFRRDVRTRSRINAVVFQAAYLRIELMKELTTLLDVFERLKDYDRKRKLYRLKFLVARMLYLGNHEELRVISDAISGITEMAMVASIYDAVITRDISQLLRYGPTAAQSAAQALLAEGAMVFCTKTDWSKSEVIHAYAVFQLNGLRVESQNPPPAVPALAFSNWTPDSFGLFHSEDPYFRELGCVHGVDDPNANRWAIETAFDRDDDLVFDIQEVMQAYPY